jgi:hypothetical protein
VGAGVANAVYPFAYGVGNPPVWVVAPGPAIDTSSLVVNNCQIMGNTAQGGTAGSSFVGGDGLGGGLFVGGGTMALKAVLVSGNQAQGGAGSQGNPDGRGLAGGVYVDPSASATMDTATLIAGNRASKSDNDVWGPINTVP